MSNTDKIIEVGKQLEEIFNRTTKGEWSMRQFPGDDDECFIEAPEPKDRNFGYAIEVFGEDTNGYDTRKADMEFAIAAHKHMPLLLEFIKECSITVGGN